MSDNKIVLEGAAQQLAEATAPHPRIYEHPPTEGRSILEKLQDSPVSKCPAKVEELTYNHKGDFKVKVVVPENVKESDHPHVIYYVHGAGWVFGSFHTHEKLARELGHKCRCVVVFPEYTLSPEAQFPVALEQMGFVLDKLPELAKERGWNLEKLTIVGDSVGGNMAAVLAARKGGRVTIDKQLLFYPVTDAAMNTKSYEEFSDGPYLTKGGMEWFWNHYIPDVAQRKDKRASPLLTPVEELKGLPPALIINAEADVLRDEGIAYADKLREAGVKVEHHTIPGIVHDFVMLHCLDETKACREAMEIATKWINDNNS